jgi:apolipoprotein N-acyltransferase
VKFKLFKRRLITPEEKGKLRNEQLLLVLSGILLGVGFTPFPMPFTLLLFFGFIPYFYVIEKRHTLAEINRATYLASFVFNVITIYWVGSWQKEADTFLMISGGLLLFVNPIFFLIPSTLLYFARKVFPNRNVIFLLPFFWGAYEYLYMVTDMSFPWLTLGNGPAKFTAFIQVSDIVGVIGLSLLIIYINILFYLAFINLKKSKKKFIYYSLAVLTVFIIVLGYGFYKINTFKESGKRIKVGLIQPNLDPWEKWEGGNLNDLTASYISLSQQAVSKGAKIIVWPETALPVFLLDGSNRDILDSIYAFLKKNNVYLITGMPDIRYYLAGENMPDDAIKESQGNLYYAMYNGILLFSPDSRWIQRYGKSKLVPFGERVPFVSTFPFLGNLIKWGVGISGWNVGRDTANFSVPYRAGQSAANGFNAKDSIYINSIVCYESIYPYYVTGFVNRGAEIIAVVTNDSWYGNSSGPYQHKDISILRAVENRRTVIRAANGGISCVIDPLGRTIIQSELFTKTFLVSDVSLEDSKTFFTRYPLIIPVLCLIVSVWVLGLFMLKKIKMKLKLK